jgi:ABC-type multidrug transport system, permease component
MFWCYLFPILLASCYFFAFNNLWKVEDFETLKIAYVSDNTKDDNLKEVLTTYKLNDVDMFKVTECDTTKAKKLLQDGDVQAYIKGSEDPVLYIKENGINQTIIKSFLDNYRQSSLAIANITKENPNAMNEGLMNDILQKTDFVKEAKNGKKPQSLLVYFYALLAFTCIYAANWGLDEVINIQADLSIRGARVNVSPINKMKLFLCNLLAAFTAHIGSITALFLYMYYVIKIDFGDNLMYLFLVCFVGSLAGLALGGTVGVWVKKKAEVKEAVLTVAVMGGAFLSGMMVADMKYTVAEKFPLLAYINPVNLVADAMYSLYYYDTYNRFYQDLIILSIITVVLGVASYIGIRRKNYASI